MTLARGLRGAPADCPPSSPIVGAVSAADRPPQDPESLLIAPEIMAADLHARMPEAEDLLGQACLALRLPHGFLLAGDPGTPTVRIVTQAFNDFADLAFELRCLRGRQALRVSRSLFELLVALLDVSADHATAWRYERHLELADEFAAATDHGLDRLPRPQARTARFALAKAAKASRPSIDAAIADYGAGFRGSWTDRSLAERATAHGLNEGYAFYRLASLTMHGAAGGAHGQVSTSIGPRPVWRLGPDLQACLLAWLHGIRFFRQLVAALPAIDSQIDVSDLDQALGRLDDAWPDYRTAVLGLDRELWPETPPTGNITILAVHRYGEQRWFVLDTSTDQMLPADPPTGALGQAQQATLDKLVGKVSNRPDGEDIWATIAIGGMRVNAKKGASATRRRPSSSPRAPAGCTPSHASSPTSTTSSRTPGPRWSAAQVPQGRNGQCRI